MDAAAKPFEVEGTIGGSSPSSPTAAREADARVHRRCASSTSRTSATRDGRQRRPTCARSTCAHASSRAWARPTRPTSRRSCATSARASATSCATPPARRASSTTTWCRSTPATASRCSCSACASTPEEPFRYLRVPADDKGAMDGFVRMRAALADPALRDARGRPLRRARRPIRSGPSWPSSCAPPPRARWRCSPAPSAPRPTPAQRAAAGRRSPSSWRPTCPRPSASAPATVLVRILNDVLFELLNLSREKAGLAPLPRRREDRRPS